MFFIIIGILIGVAAVVSVYSIVESMQESISLQMQDYGANIVVAPDRGELTFSYGGITVPEVMFGVEQLTNEDLETIENLETRDHMRWISPKLLGMAVAEEQNIILAGTRIQDEFALKPWLRLQSHSTEGDANRSTEMVDMDIDMLDLERMKVEDIVLRDYDIILGYDVAQPLGVVRGDIININGREFIVQDVLQENGSPEDRQAFVNLAVAQELLDKPGEITLIEIAADYGAGREEVLLQELESSLPGAQITSLRQAMLRQDEVLGHLTRFGASLSVIVLSLGAFLVVLTMLGTVRERTREIGIFRALGFRRSDIMKIIMMEGFALSLVGGIGGYLLGLLASRTLGPIFTGMTLEISWNFSLMVGAVSLAVLIGLAGSIYPARRGAEMDPAEALRSI